MDRRSFMRTAVGAVAGGSLANSSARVFAQPRDAADLAFLNGIILTMAPPPQRYGPEPQAVAVRDGRIIGVGTNEAIQLRCDGATQRIDLRGRCMTPGLIDAHSHLMGFGQMELYYVNLRPAEVHDFESLGNALARAAEDYESEEWIVGRGFSQFDEGRYPRREDIDPYTGDHPVLCIHWSGQFGLANTLALESAGLREENIDDPQGAAYIRDAEGIPDGPLINYPAIYSVYQPTMTEAEQFEAARWALPLFAQEGVTCVHDNFCHPIYGRRYAELEQAGEMPLRIRVYPYIADLTQCKAALNEVTRYRGPLVRFQGIKLAIDGYALMYQDPTDPSYVNLPLHTAEDFQAIISAIHAAGLQADVHAVGDLGVDLTLAAYSNAAGSNAAVAESRHRIEHFVFRRMRSIRRAGSMGVPVCTQPMYIPIRGAETADLFGDDVADTMIPLATFREEGVRVSFGADVPAFPTHRPLDSIRAAMERTIAPGVSLADSERISFMDGLQAHTIDAAYAACDEEHLGSIEVGKLADLTVWNRDLRNVTLENIDRVRVVATYVGGKRTYPADEIVPRPGRPRPLRP